MSSIRGCARWGGRRIQLMIQYHEHARCSFGKNRVFFKPVVLLGSLLMAGLASGQTTTPSPAANAVKTPTLFLIGDSTVKNGSGRGDGGLWGWGQVLAPHFDPAKIKIENRALGGRSSRTFLTEGLWSKVLTDVQPGDFVLMQFGHNDGAEFFKGTRPRGSIKGNGEETRDGVVEQTGKAETVHSFGWYLRKYIADAKARGATPIVLSPVPRNMWREGKVTRAANDYGRWAAEAAKAGGAAFVDLNEIIAKRYETAGEATVVRDYFTAKDHTHTTQAGARVNAECVVAGLRDLPGGPLNQFLAKPDDK